MNEILTEDIGLFDITTQGLGIGHLEGKITFAPKHEIVLSGAELVEKLALELGLSVKRFKASGDRVGADELILEAHGSAKSLHMLWKAAQNVLEYGCGIATKTDKMVRLARSTNPKVEILTTRKIFPRTKEMALNAVHAGGGAHHRLGLYDSILVFAQHRAFFSSKEEFEESFLKMKRRFLEKKIIVEVDSLEEGRYFARLGADILQCEKMSLEELKECVIVLKKEFPSLILSATGGVNDTNVAEIASTGVDCIVTSSPYHAKPADIRVVMKRV